jgi:ABC-type glycerol-3-phosphate transport system substrate-binding protein
VHDTVNGDRADESELEWRRDAPQLEEISMAGWNRSRNHHLSRRHVLGGALAAGALATAPRFVRAQDEDWLHAEDVSTLPPTSMRYWFYESPERVAIGERQVEEFQAAHPNITIEARTAPPDVDNEQLLAFIRSGTNSHVHQTVNNEDTWYIRHELLQPLDELPGFQEVWDRLEPAANYTWADGHVYSLSWYTDPMAMYYNRALVEEAGLDPENPPITYSEYLEWAAALTKDTNGDGQPDQWFITLPIGEEWWNYEFVHYPYYIAATGGNQLVSDDGTTAVFNSPASLQSYELVNELFRQGYSAAGPFDVDPFLSGLVASTLEGGWMLKTAQTSAPEGFEYIVGPLPKPDDAPHEGNPSFVFVRSLNLMREQELEGAEAAAVDRAAWEFLKFVLSPEEMAADFAATGEFAAAADLLTNPLYTEPLDSLGPQARWVAEYGQNGFIYDMNTPYESEMTAILQQTWAEMALGNITPQDALSQAEQQVNDLLANPPAD